MAHSKSEAKRIAIQSAKDPAPAAQPTCSCGQPFAQTTSGNMDTCGRVACIDRKAAAHPVPWQVIDGTRGIQSASGFVGNVETPALAARIVAAVNDTSTIVGLSLEKRALQDLLAEAVALLEDRIELFPDGPAVKVRAFLAKVKA